VRSKQKVKTNVCVCLGTLTQMGLALTGTWPAGALSYAIAFIRTGLAGARRSGSEPYARAGGPLADRVWGNITSWQSCTLPNRNKELKQRGIKP